MDFGIKENADVSLHDCRADKIQYDEQYIKFHIPDGFYIIQDKKDPASAESFNAEVTCHFADKYEDHFSVSVFRKNVFGKIIREDWTDRFVSEINSGRFVFEFVYTYRSYHGVLFKGYIWQDRKPWWKECEIELKVDEITYSWDER